MKNDNRKIGEIIDSAKTYIVVTNESVVAKGRKAELMALISSFLENQTIDEDDLNFIISLAKENIKKDNKRNKESIENILDKTIEDIVKKFFDFENKD
ncbi:MAG TPA: hypothetical protein DDW20_05400 [Firmicutes bacterium]|nr:hypothetical protein [Bacillota bacterium]